MPVGLKGHTNTPITPNPELANNWNENKETALSWCSKQVLQYMWSSWSRKKSQNSTTATKIGTGASSSMEPDIIISGFKEAESKHVLRYTEFVGDGDCSVYPKLITGVLFGLFFPASARSQIACNTCFEHHAMKQLSGFSFQLFATWEALSRSVPRFRGNRNRL